MSENILNCTCRICQTKFYESPSRIKIGRGKYCSKRCYERSQLWTPAYFWSKVNKTKTCWLWTGRLEFGYGRIGGKHNRVFVHRAAWDMLRGPSHGQDVLHKCDVRNCVNPDHLMLGDHTANMADMVSKNRQAKGELVGTSKLTNAQVQEIKEGFMLWRSKSVVAQRYGVCPRTMSPRTMSLILNGTFWKHIK